MSLAIMLDNKENNKFIRCTEEQQHKTLVTCWRIYSLIPGNNPQLRRLLKVHNSRSYEEKVCLLEDPCIICRHHVTTVYDERLVRQIQSEYFNNKKVSWRNQIYSIENQFKVIDCKSCSNCKISTFISPSHLKHTIIAKYSRTCLKGSFAFDVVSDSVHKVGPLC